ncbi:MAG: acyl-CoA thioesterase [Nitrospirae bacterium]|nr:acyl-CoA thioesterase [Nitrospirota bacterium]
MKAHETKLNVRFPEVDSFDVVWHGHYITYFEIGRLDLCGRFGLSPATMKQLGYFAPVVDMKCRIRASARYDDGLIVQTSVNPSDKAMLVFTYTIIREKDRQVIAEGETAHVLLTLDRKMLYEVPEEVKAGISGMLAYLDAA